MANGDVFSLEDRFGDPTGYKYAKGGNMKKKIKKEEGFWIKILNTKNVKMVEMQVEMDDSAKKLLLGYAKEHLDKVSKEGMLVEWAFRDILQKQCDKAMKEEKVLPKRGKK